MLRVLGGIGYCQEGNHATASVFSYDGRGYCPEHLPEPGPGDRLPPGTCEIGRGHYARGGVRWVPARGTVGGRFMCQPHFHDYVDEIVRRGFWRS